MLRFHDEIALRRSLGVLRSRGRLLEQPRELLHQAAPLNSVSVSETSIGCFQGLYEKSEVLQADGRGRQIAHLPTGMTQPRRGTQADHRNNSVPERDLFWGSECVQWRDDRKCDVRFGDDPQKVPSSGGGERSQFVSGMPDAHASDQVR